MKKLFTFLSRANNNNSMGNKNLNVSTNKSLLAIIAMVVMMLLGNTNVWADYSESSSDYTKTWDFGTNNPAVNEWGNYGWTHVGSTHQYSQTFNNATNGMHMLQDLKFNGDIVLYDNGSGIYLDANKEASVSIPVGSGNTVKVTGYVPSGTRGAVWDNVSNTPESWGSTTTTATAKAASSGYVTLTYNNNRALFITKIEVIAKPYAYDPAIETYDLYYNTNSFTSDNLSDAGFKLDYDDYEAQYLNFTSGLALNNRIAISQVNNEGTKITPWEIDHGFKSKWAWHNISITNLVEGDRVVITWMGSAKFSSKAEQMAYNGCAAFKDNGNDGDFTEGEDTRISCGISLDAKEHHTDYYAQEEIYTSYPYVITEDGHLDIALSNGSKIVKVVIYADHQAQMIDRDNDYGTSTSYFDKTGQLEIKHHIVPGGLHVYIGNEKDTEHAEVVMSDKGPVSFVYDDLTSHDANSHHYKMARQGEWGRFNVWDDLPVTGTYYKFVPEVSGKMWVKFKASSVNYRNYGKPGNAAVDDNGTPNEVTNNVSCPYYLMVVNDNNKPTQVESHNYSNGADGYFGDDNGNPTDGQNKGITVERGKTYYLYGWWDVNNNGGVLDDIDNHACGIAELLEVTFLPNQMVEPLAKWVESGTTEDDNLATVKGYNTVCVKKKSSNIASCEPYIEGGKLKIKNIVFNDADKGGGTILIKIGDRDVDAYPVFAYTIAYDASYEPDDWTDESRSKGHTWDFSTNPLNGLEWENRYSQEATPTDFGTSTDDESLLSKEIAKGDWTFNYRVKASNGTTHDPRFLNNWDMEGDNADMIWDTEGLIFKTSSNQSCIYNEFGGVVDHSKIGTKDDPDRYVGILPGGSFTIPKLEAGDRVEIFMGSGEGSGSEACFFNITNALDAIGKEITETYKAGGSHWQQNQGNASQYRGAYQFISTGGDMTFTMNGGSMTKLYSIRIYTGVKTGTVDCTRVQSVTYNNEDYNGYTYSFNNDWRTTTPVKGAIALHYRGKGERLRTPTILHTSGNVSTGSENLIYAEIGDNNAPYILYKSKKQDYGMFRMRVEDLELSNTYVADYALQNITVGYLLKKNYPYTWDFTDLMGYVKTDARILGERTNVSGYDPRTVDEDEAYEIEFMNNSVGEDVKAVEQWKQYAASADGDIPAGYGLHINNEPYGGGCMWAGGQLYAYEEAFDETFGLSILPPLNNQGESAISKDYNGGVRIIDDGLCLTGGIWRIMIPLVGGEEVASVYIRAKQIGSRDITAGVGSADTPFTYVGTATDGTEDKIYAVKGTGDDMTLFFNNLIIKKIAISQDSKTVNKLGYATESRNVEIDPELMGYMTGTGLKAYTVTKVVYGDNAGDIPSITLTEIPSNKLMGPATTGDHRGYIIYNTDDTKTVNILDGGFHLFVPDMHDESKASKAKKSILDTEDGENYLRSHINSGSIPQNEDIDGVNYTNYLMNYKYSDKYGTHEGPEAFYRAGVGAALAENKAYLQLLTAKVKPTDASFSKSFAIIFEDEFNGINPGITTVIEDASQLMDNNAEWYNLNGQKMNGKPSSRGLYIINGKKVVVK